MAMIPMTAARLREAMRDPRYWQQGNPERADYNAWATQGWRALVETPADQKTDGVVQVQAYERRGPDGTMVQLQAHQRGAPPARAWESQPNSEWRALIARAETNRDTGDFGYGMRGQTGTALGRYQMLTAALRAAGWKDANGNWTGRAVSAGVRSNEDFLNNREAQEQAFNDYLRDNELRLRRNGSWSLIGNTVPALRGEPVPITASGLAAAAHREGVRQVARYLAHRQRRDPIPPSVSGGGDLSSFSQIEKRLRNFASVPYSELPR